MTVINTNIASMNAQYSLNKVNKAMEDTMQQLSTGKRINSAADDAAGLSIASTMETQLRGINMQIRNAQDGISLVQTVEGALEESSSILQRMSELATQASNSVFSADDRAALQSEVEQLKTELDRIAQDTKFNGQTILDGSYANKQLNVGFGANGNIGVDIGNHSAASLSAAGETDAMSQLTAAAASIATGLNNQAVTSTTTQAAVSKADTQAVGRTIAQINVGADNTQAVSMANVTKNVVATSTVPDKVGTLAAPTMVQNIGAISVGTNVNSKATFALVQTDGSETITVSTASGIAGTLAGGGTGGGGTVTTAGVTAAATFSGNASATFAVNAAQAGIYVFSDGVDDVSVAVAGSETPAQMGILVAAAITADATMSAKMTAVSDAAGLVTFGDKAGSHTFTVGGESLVVNLVADSDKNTTATAIALAITNDTDGLGKLFTAVSDGVDKVTLTATTGTVTAAVNDTAKTYTFGGTANTSGVSSTFNTTVSGTVVATTTTGSETAAQTATLFAAAVNNDATLTANFLATVEADGVTVGITPKVGIFKVRDSAVDVENRVAGVNPESVASLQAISDVAGDDGASEVKAYRVDGNVMQGDVFSLEIDGKGAVAYTVSQGDLSDSSAQTKRNAIDSFVSTFNNSSSALRNDGDSGEITLARSTNDAGDDYITMTAQYPRPAANAMVVTAFTLVDRATTSAVTGDLAAATTVAAAAGVTAKQELTVSNIGNVRVGDTYSINIQSLGAIDYQVKGSDIGVNDTVTMTNVRQSIVDNFNSAEGYLTQSPAAGKITAGVSSTNSAVIELVGDDATTGATFTSVVSLVAMSADTTEAVTLVTDASILAGTHDVSINAGSAAIAATRQIEITQDTTTNADVGDIVSMNVGGTDFSYEVKAADTFTTIADGLVAAINGLNTGGTGQKVDIAGAGEITASNVAGIITLTAENKGAASDFAVSTSTSNATAVAQKQVYEVNVTAAYTEGQSARLSFGANNELTVEITADIAAMTAAQQEQTITAAFIAQSSTLQGISLSAHSSDTTKIIATSDNVGVAALLDGVRSGGVDAVATAQVEKMSFSGYVGKGDIFTFNNGANSVSVVVDDTVASLDTNDERLAGVRDAMLLAIRSDATLNAAYTVAVDGANAMAVTALVAGTAFSLASSTTSNMSSTVANQAKVEDLTLSGDVEAGDTFSIDMGNGSTASYVATAADASGSTAAERLTAARDGLMAAASAAFGSTLTVEAKGTDAVRLTAQQAGTDFRAVATSTNAADVAQVETVSFSNVGTGDTFSLTVGGETASYTAAQGDTSSSVATWMSNNASFSGKSVAVDSDGNLAVTGAGGESFAVSSATTNYTGNIQSSSLALSGTIETGDSYAVTLNGENVSVAVTAAMTSISDVASAMVSAINGNSALSANVEASLADDGSITIASKVLGQGFTAEASVSDVGRSRNSVAEIDISTETGANAAASVVSDALKQVNATRSNLGAIENRLNHTINNLGNIEINTSAAQSRIQDTDFAATTSQLAKSQIMSQAATAMLAQANAAKQSVLSLLQG